MTQRYVLRSKNKGKRWGIFDRVEKRWHLKPGFYQPLGHAGDDGVQPKLGPPVPLNTSAAEVADLLPEVIAMRKQPQQPQKENADEKKQQKTKKHVRSHSNTGGDQGSNQQP